MIWIFESYANKSKNDPYPSPRYLDEKVNKPICDVLIMCGATAVLIEAKARNMRRPILDIRRLKMVREYMDKRFVEGTDRPVGVSQLLTAIDNIGTMPRENFREWLRGVKKIIPVIITKDDIGSSWATNAYLNARFQQKLNRLKYKKLKVTPLVKHERFDRWSGLLPRCRRWPSATSWRPDSGRPEARAVLSRRQAHGCIEERLGRWDKHIEILTQCGKEMQADFGMAEE